VTDARRADERIRDAYARMLDARGGGSRDACATPEAMLAVARREGSDAARLATLDHVMACGACSRELELLRALDEAGGRAAGERTADVVPLRQRASWRRVVPVALAASVLAVAGVGLLGRAGRDAKDVARGEAGAVTLLAPVDAAGPRAPITFAWRPVPGATRYELEVLDAAGAVALGATTVDTVVVARAGRLAPGGAYRWWVRARDAAGAQRASEMRPLRVRAE
jgi:hypothetical protein